MADDLPHLAKSFGNMIFHRFYGDIHLLRHFFIGESMERLEDHYFFPHRGKRFDSGVHFPGDFQGCAGVRHKTVLSQRSGMNTLQPFFCRGFVDMIDQDAAGNNKDLLFQRMAV